METFERVVALSRDRQVTALDRAATFRLRRALRQRARQRPSDLARGRRTWHAVPSHLSRIRRGLRAWSATGAPRLGEEGHDA
jgi:hypothetical protein